MTQASSDAAESDPQPGSGSASVTAKSPEEFARRALRWEASYCAVAGITVAAFATSIEQQLGLSAWIVATIGIGAVGWSGLLAVLARHHDWRRSTGIAATANTLATMTIGYWAVNHGGPGGIILGLLALQIAAFGVVEMWPLVDR